MKKYYVKPAMQATEIEGICIICTSVQNNAGLNPTIKGSSTISGTPTARSKGRGYWDEDEEDWEEDW